MKWRLATIYYTTRSEDDTVMQMYEIMITTTAESVFI